VAGDSLSQNLLPPVEDAEVKLEGAAAEEKRSLVISVLTLLFSIPALIGA